MNKFITLSLLLAVLIGSTCEKDTPITPTPPVPPIACEDISCEVSTEWFGKGIRNGECWVAESIIFDKSERNDIFIELNEKVVNGIWGSLALYLDFTVNIRDTIWLGRKYTGSPRTNIGSSTYSYLDGHVFYGRFNFPEQEQPSASNFLLIDYFNSDTTVIEGRFQVTFSQRWEDRSISIPDSMRIDCGSFRVQRY